MGAKDITEKTLEAYNDVFADIINVLLFNGKQTVKENELEDAIVRYHYKADGGKLHEMERDTAKYWKDSNIRIACFGYENQTMPDIDAPLRGAGYDGSEYRRQMLADYEETTGPDGAKKITRKRNPRYPVITLFLYLDEAPIGQERKDLAMVIRSVLKQRIVGVKNESGVYVTPAFPKLIYVLDEDNVREESPYCDLTVLAAKCTAKRMVPDYISAKVMR